MSIYLLLVGIALGWGLAGLVGYIGTLNNKPASTVTIKAVDPESFEAYVQAQDKKPEDG